MGDSGVLSSDRCFQKLKKNSGGGGVDLVFHQVYAQDGAGALFDGHLSDKVVSIGLVEWDVMQGGYFLRVGFWAQSLLGPKDKRRDEIA